MSDVLIDRAERAERNARSARRRLLSTAARRRDARSLSPVRDDAGRVNDADSDPWAVPDATSNEFSWDRELARDLDDWVVERIGFDQPPVVEAELPRPASRMSDHAESLRNLFAEGPDNQEPEQMPADASAGELLRSLTQILGNIGRPYRVPRRVGLGYCQAVKDIFFCNICDDLIYPDYRQCDNGHSLCGSCIRNVARCPYCNDVRPYWSNRLLQNVVSTLSFPCRHSHLGCTEYIPAADWHSHSDSCSHSGETLSLGTANRLARLALNDEVSM